MADRFDNDIEGGGGLEETLSMEEKHGGHQACGSGYARRSVNSVAARDRCGAIAALHGANGNRGNGDPRGGNWWDGFLHRGIAVLFLRRAVPPCSSGHLAALSLSLCLASRTPARHL